MNKWVDAGFHDVRADGEKLWRLEVQAIGGGGIPRRIPPRGRGLQRH